MDTVNEVRILGRLGSEPEVRRTSSGTAVANLSVATHRSWTDDDGERQERTEWHRVVVWGQRAGFARKYLEKGDPVFVGGRLQYRTWTDSDGLEHESTEVVARRLIGLGASGSSGEDEEFSEAALMGGDDDLPF